jgi:PHD/YefM family antitoxin component YafN of YafNO toxin-antitoxin module
MSKTISSDEVRQQWDTVVGIAKGGDDVVIQSSGETQVVVISPEAYRELQEAREKLRRSEAVSRLEALRRRQAERNKDLTDEEIDEIAIQTGRQINEAATRIWRESLESDKS